MNIGIIGIPGKKSSEKLTEATRKYAGQSSLISMQDVCADISSGMLFHQGRPMDDFDALVIKKVHPFYSHHMADRLEMLDVLKRQGVPIFSDPVGIARAVNRLTCTIELVRGGIPIPETVVTENATEARDVVAEFGSAVLKPLFTSKARGMVVIEDGPGAGQAIRDYQKEHPILYIQKKIDHPGSDLGLVFLGGEYLGTYARVAEKGHWNTTTQFGGHYEPFEPDRELIDIATKAQSLFGLDYTSVDVVITEQGPMVFEVSAFGGFSGLWATSGIDAADLYARYVVEKVKNGNR